MSSKVVKDRPSASADIADFLSPTASSRPLSKLYTFSCWRDCVGCRSVAAHVFAVRHGSRTHGEASVRTPGALRITPLLQAGLASFALGLRSGFSLIVAYIGGLVGRHGGPATGLATTPPRAKQQRARQSPPSRIAKRPLSGDDKYALLEYACYHGCRDRKDRPR